MGVSGGLNSWPDYAEIVGNSEAALIMAIFLEIGISFLVAGFIFPGLIHLGSKIWNGKASMRQAVNACSISMFPSTLILFNQLLNASIGNATTLGNVNQGVLYGLWVWSFSLLIIGVARVQGFSYGRALTVIILSNLPIVIIALLVRN